MPNPSRVLTPAFTSFVRVLACLAFATAFVPGIAAAQTHHWRRNGRHHRAAGARSSRRQHHGSHRRHPTSGSTSGSGSSSGNQQSDGSSSGGKTTSSPPVTTAPGTPIIPPPVTTAPGTPIILPPVTAAPGTPIIPPVTVAPGTPITGPSSTGSGGGRPFAASSPWNVTIPPDPVLDPNSAEIAKYVGYKAAAALYEDGVPIWEASPSDPLNNVPCTEPWGTCQLSQQPIPIPSTAQSSPGSDHAMVVIDENTGYDFWQASRTSPTSWTTSWGTSFSVAGSGYGDGATGAGIPLLAGVAKINEMTEEKLNHALTFSTNATCKEVFQYPASKTDGKTTNTYCLPEGARVQLDPEINVDAIPGITSGEKTVAHALQTYGAYCRDSTGSGGGGGYYFEFENPIGKPNNPYPSLGFPWDSYNMPHIPWSKLRVLKTWNGS
jgi:hypothetical protein